MGTGEGFASAGSDGWVGPPNIGLSPERIRILSEEAKTRIAAENAAKEAHKAERAQLKADKKAKKSGEKDQVYEQDGSQKLDVNQSWDSTEHKQEKKGMFASFKKLLKKDQDGDIVR